MLQVNAVKHLVVATQALWSKNERRDSSFIGMTRLWDDQVRTTPQSDRGTNENH
jgi:hypothetical protein